MFGYRSPSRHSAHWTTSLQPSVLRLFSPNSVTSDSWRKKLYTDVKKPALAYLWTALPLHFPSSFLFSVFMGLRIIRPAVLLSHSLFFRGALSTELSHTQLLPGDKFSSQHRFFRISHLSPLIVQFLFTRPCDPLSVMMPPQLFVLVYSRRLVLEEVSNERFRGRKLLCCLAFPFINHRLTDLLSLQITPHLSQRHSRCSAQ